MDFAKPSTSSYTTGRLNPGFSDKVTALSGNLFLKFMGLESFTTLEQASGRQKDEITGERTANQFATDLLYRFGKDENFWVGARYNTFSATMPKTAAVNAVANPVTTAVAALAPYKVGADKLAVSAGWFITKNVMAKLEYVQQNYDYKNAPQSILNGGKFSGFIVEAVVGF
jgi:hypothetical protein